jgi:hypothetical protein
LGGGGWAVWDLAAGVGVGGGDRVGVLPPGLLTVSPDGRSVVSAVERGGYFRRLDLATGKVDPEAGDRLGDYFSTAPVFSPDGRTFALAGGPRNRGGSAAWVIEAASLDVRLELTGDPSLHRVAFSPDGRTLATGGYDGSVALWDLIGADRAGPEPRPAPADLWAKLTARPAAPAWAAARALIANPEVALPLLRERVRPARATTDAEIETLIRRLDAPAFADREAASRELARLGHRAEPAVRKAASGDVSPEVARRLRELLKAKAATGPNSEDLAHIRAVEVVEWIGTPAAQDVLKSWSSGAGDAVLARESKAALARLGARAQ